MTLSSLPHSHPGAGRHTAEALARAEFVLQKHAPTPGGAARVVERGVPNVLPPSRALRQATFLGASVFLTVAFLGVAFPSDAYTGNSPYVKTAFFLTGCLLLAAIALLTACLVEWVSERVHLRDSDPCEPSADDWARVSQALAFHPEWAAHVARWEAGNHPIRVRDLRVLVGAELSVRRALERDRRARGTAPTRRLDAGVRDGATRARSALERVWAARPASTAQAIHRLAAATGRAALRVARAARAAENRRLEHQARARDAADRARQEHLSGFLGDARP